LARVEALPTRLDDELLGKLVQFAGSPPPALPLADKARALQFLRVLSTMPRRGEDDATGKIRTEIITSRLVGLPVAQIDWTLNEALLRFTFFPSVKEIMELAGEWERNDDAVRARRLAASRVRHEALSRLEDARSKLKWGECSPEWIAALPEHTAKVLLSERLLKKCAKTGALAQGNFYREWCEFLERQQSGDAVNEGDSA